jgi:hypothetical protein
LSAPISIEQLKHWGCTVIPRATRQYSIDSQAGVKDASGTWIGRITPNGGFEPNYTTMTARKPRLRVKAKVMS